MAGLGRDEVRRIGQRYIDLVGLTDYASLLPRELSGGMKKRVDIARAMANEPELLLMDEPFGALDAMTRQRFQDELLQLWETDRRTIIFVTHDLEEAVYLGSRVAIMGREPNLIHSLLSVPLPRPRTPTMRTRPSSRPSGGSCGSASTPARPARVTVREHLRRQTTGGARDVKEPASPSWSSRVLTRQRLIGLAVVATLSGPLADPDARRVRAAAVRPRPSPTWFAPTSSSHRTCLATSGTRS